MKLHIPAKIIIGTIPLQVVNQQYQTHPGVSAPQLSAQASSYLPTSIPTPSAPPMADTLPKSNTRESGLNVELGLIFLYRPMVHVYFLKFHLVYAMKLKYITLN